MFPVVLMSTVNIRECCAWLKRAQDHEGEIFAEHVEKEYPAT
jgi:hypothetical protein